MCKRSGGRSYPKRVISSKLTNCKGRGPGVGGGGGGGGGRAGTKVTDDGTDAPVIDASPRPKLPLQIQSRSTPKL